MSLEIQENNEEVDDIGTDESEVVQQGSGCTLGHVAPVDGDPQMTCSSNDGLECIDLEGTKVWGKSQNLVEQEALLRLNLLTRQTGSEDGELSNDCSNSTTDENKREERGVCTLDIKKYIETQEKLRQQKAKHSAKNASATSVFSSRKRRISEEGSAKKKKRKLSEQDSDQEKGTSEADSGIVRSVQDADGGEEASGSEYIPSEESDSGTVTPRRSNCKKNVDLDSAGSSKARGRGRKRTDDTELSDYQQRLAEVESKELEEEDREGDYEVCSGGPRVPWSIWRRLYDYQKQGVEWMWRAHRKKRGCLLGDEMGLGKTVQVIAFLAGLQNREAAEPTGPTLIVCPATVVQQWLRHFHEWWAPFRVRLLHKSGGNEREAIKSLKWMGKGHGDEVFITTYEGALKQSERLAKVGWHYVVLDEGHKIRNPAAKVTKALKRLKTSYRLVLTGSPMQNNLQELWSVFDFVEPGMLGSLQAFSEHVASPITRGGCASASTSEQMTAEMLAASLKDMIRPHLLRRSKNQVNDAIRLPPKNEQVLFCTLTEEQSGLYKQFLLSEHVGGLLGRTSCGWQSYSRQRADILVAIGTLRKICNHPDLYWADGEGDAHPSRGGKTQVVSALLKMWKRQGHRALVFSQTRATLDVLECVARRGGHKYLRMDGTTPVATRQPLVDAFNSDPSHEVFLLTTRVGGLGVNLTGADRVVIFDPDWNPATDTQARERAWRIGQNRDVTVYRLITAGTIEEKMFQRQVWKQLLCNQVLLDPKTLAYFKRSSLKELFSLQEDGREPESASIFADQKVELPRRENKDKDGFTDEKIRAMRKLAQQISKKIVKDKEEQERQSRPTPAELLAYNRAKMIPVEESVTNRIDDQETEASFSSALELAEKSGEDYRRSGKRRKPDEIKVGVKVDNSGKIDGEQVEGLVRREMPKKKSKKKKNKDKEKEEQVEDQDEYVLQKLFSKKGVRGALHHDGIVNGGGGGGDERNELKVHYESKMRADRALAALRRSRLDAWRY